MQKAIFSLFISLLFFETAGAVCHQCEIIRERNRNDPGPKEEYYEDFLEARRAEGNEVRGKIEFIAETPEEEETENL